ncbi:hypothetical protein PINS_up003991 [Pythium insidiosum]|nr:hypothetical protein PINS_up003991 [Pythium insidiosum]
MLDWQRPTQKDAVARKLSAEDLDVKSSLPQSDEGCMREGSGEDAALKGSEWDNPRNRSEGSLVSAVSSASCRIGNENASPPEDKPDYVQRDDGESDVSSLQLSAISDHSAALSNLSSVSSSLVGTNLKQLLTSSSTPRAKCDER